MFVGAGCRVKTSSAQLNKGASSFVSQHHVYHGNFLAEETSFILVDLSHSNQKRFGSQSAAGILMCQCSRIRESPFRKQRI